jgi:hypothetical protein
MTSVSTETMEQRPENKYSPAEVALARELAKMRIRIDIAPKETHPNGVPKIVYENLTIPIKKIDGISVTVNFHMSNAEEIKHTMSLCIEHSRNYIAGNIFYRRYPFTKETAQDDTMIILEVIKSLSFNKSTTRFITNCNCCKKNEEEMKPELWCGLFEDCEKIEMKWDTCCVCHEMTNIKFKNCGHTICLVCCEKLIETDINNDMIIKCPICREEHYAGDIDNEDELLVSF